LAKTASSLHKPDGLDEINRKNFKKVYSRLELIDLSGIKTRNAARLNSMGIYTVTDFYNAHLWKLKAAFSSITGYYWCLRLHGFEIDDLEFARRSYGNSYALPRPLVEPFELAPILSKLVTKMGARLRRAGYKARGVRVAVSYRDGSYWHKGVTYPKVFFDSKDIYREAFRIFLSAPYKRSLQGLGPYKRSLQGLGPYKRSLQGLGPYKKAVRELAVSCFHLLKNSQTQLDLFEDIKKKEKLIKAVDVVNERWGDFTIAPARMLTATKAVPDRIAFGGVKELEEFVSKF